jgi:hypothetical protein
MNSSDILQFPVKPFPSDSNSEANVDGFQHENELKQGTDIASEESNPIDNTGWCPIA